MPLTESLAPMVPIQLDKPRNLVFDNEAMIQIEEQLPGESTFDPKFWGKINAKRARIILWAGLLYDEPTITLEQVKVLLRGRDFAPIVRKILEAWGWSTPEADEVTEKENPLTPVASFPSGSTSGQ